LAQEKKRADKCEEKLDENSSVSVVRNGKRNGSPGSFEEVKDMVVDLRRYANDSRYDRLFI
jgi:hypothetical protein